MSSCSIIANVTDPIARCELAREHCQLDSLIPYGELVFCKLSSVPLQVIVLIFAMMLSFSAIGIAAFDHLSPNLTYIAEVSGLSQSLIGVTVLAFGNGSVDVFGALVALGANEGGMAFGGILGGALFVISVVIGSMAIIKPFSIEIGSFERDAVFLLLSVILTLFVIYDGVVTLTETLLGLLLYTVYAVFAVRQQLCINRKTARNIEEGLADAALLSLPATEDEQICGPFKFEELPYTALKPSLHSAFNIYRRVHKHLNNIELSVPSPFSTTDLMAAEPQNRPKNNPKRHMRRRSSAPDLINFNNEADLSVLMHASNNKIPPAWESDTHSPGVPLKFPFQVPQLRLPSSGDASQENDSHDAQNNSHPHFQQENYRILSPPGSALLHSDYHNQLSPNIQSPTKDSNTSAENIQPPQNVLRPFRSFESEQIDFLKHESYYSPFLMKHLVNRLIESQMPAESPNVNEFSGDGSFTEKASQKLLIFPFLEGWSEKGWIQRINELMLAPFMSILAWSIPMCNRSNCRINMSIYSVGVPAVLPLLIKSLKPTKTLVLIQILTSLSGVFWWGYLQRPGPPKLAVAALGFCMGILWVMLLATELVTNLTILGLVCHVSNTVMGLTVFAIGDSLGDFVSNITIARIGFPTMAIAACFGGPIFTLLVGISGASLVTMIKQRKAEIRVPVSASLLLNGGALIIILSFLVIATTRNDNTVTKKTGVCLILMWAVTVIVSTAMNTPFINNIIYRSSS